MIDVYEKFNLTVEYSPGQSDFFAEEINKVDREIDALQAHGIDSEVIPGVTAAR